MHRLRQAFSNNLNYTCIMPRYSFLLPTRRRAELCIGSIESIFKNSNDKNCFEILLAFDDDDQESREMVEKYCIDNNIIHNIQVSKRYGYENLHEYVNNLCLVASGEMLWLWNDDARMETSGWDVLLEKYGADKVIDFKNNHYPFIFPLVPKKYVDCLGHFSLSAHNDTWIEIIFKKNLNMAIFIDDVELYHNRTNPRFQVDYEEVEKSMVNYSRKYFYSQEASNNRLEDVNKLIRTFFKNMPLFTTSE
jgi:hypothetical protein